MHSTKDQMKDIKILRQRADFLRIQSKGRKWVSHGLILQVMPNDLGHIRLGFTISKKTDKSAVKRNRIKRRLRAVAFDTLPLHANKSCDYILVGRPASAMRSYEALCEDLRWCLKKMDLRHEPDADNKN